MKTLVFSIYLCVLCTTCKKSGKEKDIDTTPVGITDRVLTENLAQPWEILWGPDDFIWMTERVAASAA
ncbi:hypothetical protein [Paraflavitalea speifideaquila]|uniref:hypothetical protein n=1 Tax=Paraflavitalea speifideaquila TaxID=3076558 RepID=UPI0028E5BE08|nr:hypothetical protein [Paraflavitalea speifideiaquila]